MTRLHPSGRLVGGDCPDGPTEVQRQLVRWLGAHDVLSSRRPGR